MLSVCIFNLFGKKYHLFKMYRNCAVFKLLSFASKMLYASVVVANGNKHKICTIMYKIYIVMCHTIMIAEHHVLKYN